jgi:hypothetical protein
MSDFSGLDLDKIMRRGGGEEKKRELPSELYQIAIFYQRPVVEELELRKRDILLSRACFRSRFSAECMPMFGLSFQC